MEDDEVAAGESDPNEYDEVVTTRDTETIDAFFIPHYMCEDRDSLHWYGVKCDDSGPMC